MKLIFAVGLMFMRVRCHIPFEDEASLNITQLLNVTENTNSTETNKTTPFIQQWVEDHPEFQKVFKMIADGSMEYLVAILLIAYAFTYYFGVKRNETIAMEWLDNVRSLVFSNFAVAGTSNKELENEE